MSATIGAALKKIAVALFTNPKALKTILGIILGILIIIFIPIAAVLSIFNGDIKPDRNRLNTIIEQRMTAEQNQYFQTVNDTMEKVEKELEKKKLSKYNTQAEIIYIFSLTDKSSDENFVKDFVSCFKKDQSNEDLIKAVNKKFNVNINYDEFSKMLKSVKSSKISLDGYYDPKVKNNLDLAKWCINAEEKGWGYVWGGYGQICTIQYLDQQAAMYPDGNEAGGEMRKVGEKWLGKRVTDCIGLIKSYAWYNADTGEIHPGANSFTDCSANSIWNYVSESGDISSIPEVPGLAVWMNGHIGVYVGDGYVVEAQGTAYGVVKTKLQGRGWSKWLKIPNIKYVEEKKNEKDKGKNK